MIEDIGGILSPYTCERFLSKGETDIEHIVALSEAHDSGLCGANAATRRQFARDPLNLTLANPAVNRYQKGAKDGAEWSPDRNACWFAARSVTVRQKYGLTIDQREADALDRILDRCLSTVMHCEDAGPSGVLASAQIGDETLAALHVSAEQGDAEAQFNLGVMYATGDGVPQDDVSAHMWLNLAASRSTGTDREQMVAARDAVAARMSRAALEEAQRRARNGDPNRRASTPRNRAARCWRRRRQRVMKRNRASLSFVLGWSLAGTTFPLCKQLPMRAFLRAQQRPSSYGFLHEADGSRSCLPTLVPCV